MDRIDTVRVFAGVVKRSSFSQTARDLSLPRSTVTEAVRQIEEQMSVKLLERTTQMVRATPEGLAYYERCRAILTSFDRLA